MENLNMITSFFRQVWDIFTIPHPLLGIPFSVIYLGVFTIAFSITILKPMLGIGYGAVGDISRGARNLRNKAKSSRYKKHEEREGK